MQNPVSGKAAARGVGGSDAIMTAQTKERPIILNAEQVRAVLSGDMTQYTVPIIAKVPEWTKRIELRGSDYVAMQDTMGVGIGKSPFGQPGDKLWVKELILCECYASRTWNDLSYDADGDCVMAEIPSRWSPPADKINRHWESGDNIPGGGFEWFTASIPPSKMPRWASRVTLEVVTVGARRLQDMPDDEIYAEGIFEWAQNYMDKNHGGGKFKNIRSAYKYYWNARHKEKPGLAWDDNPWVWHVDWKKVAK